MRFPIAFSSWYRILSWIVGVPPSRAFVTVDADRVNVRMGWSFRATFPRSAITGATRDESRPISRGVHGWRGRWLVNGAGHPLVAIDVEPSVRAWFTGVPIRLRRVTVSVDEPGALLAALDG